MRTLISSTPPTKQPPPNKALQLTARQHGSQVISFSLNADRAPQLKAGVMRLSPMDAIDEIQSMWDAWKTQRFPSEYSGKDVAGICVTSLDSFAAGCIDTFIFRKGRLDDQRISVLENAKLILRLL